MAWHGGARRGRARRGMAGQGRVHFGESSLFFRGGLDLGMGVPPFSMPLSSLKKGYRQNI